MLKKFNVVYHTILLCLLLLFYLFSAKAEAEPIQMKNHAPIWFGLLYPTPDRTEPLENKKHETSLQFEYSSIFFLKERAEWYLLFDMEITQLTISHRIGLPNQLETGIEASAIHMGGGFLDNTIINFHNTTGFPNYIGQEESPRDRFLYGIWHYDEEWNHAVPYTFTLGETNIWLKKGIWHSDDKIVSAKLVIQAPTAPADIGIGNGSWEWSALLLYKLTLYSCEMDISGGYVDTGYYKRGEIFYPHDFLFLRGSMEKPVNGRYSLILQGTVSSTPFYVPIWGEATFGVRYRAPDGSVVTVGLLEDLSKTAPDFTFHLSYTF